MEIGSSLVYFDQNVFSGFVKDKCDNILSELKVNKKFTYVYSPAHGEELYRMPSGEKKKRLINLIKEITHEYAVLPNDSIEGGLELRLDRMTGMFWRCSQYREATEWVEDIKVKRIKSHKEENQKKLKAMGNVGMLYDVLTDEDFGELIKRSGSTPPSGIFFKSGFRRLKTHKDINDAVYTLHNIMDVLNYKVDRKERRARSSLYDIEHCKYASKCKFFVTDDIKLRERAKQIYHFMEKDTQVLSKKQFFQRELNLY